MEEMPRPRLPASSPPAAPELVGSTAAAAGFPAHAAGHFQSASGGGRRGEGNGEKVLGQLILRRRFQIHPQFIEMGSVSVSN